MTNERYSWTINGSMTSHTQDSISNLPQLGNILLLFNNGVINNNGWRVESTANYSLCDPACMSFIIIVLITFVCFDY